MTRIRKGALTAAILGGFVLFGIAHMPTLSSRSVPSVPVAAVSSAIEKHQCNRCHVPEDDPNRQATCVGCHQAILAGEFDRQYGTIKTTRWKQNIRHLLWAPDLKVSARRLDPEWIRGFLKSPHQIRPNLGSEMPKLPLSEADIEDLVVELSRESVSPALTTAPALGSVESGKGLLNAKGCLGCHQYSGAIDSYSHSTVNDLNTPFHENPQQLARAPDLRFVRERMSALMIGDFLDDPERLAPGTLMPKIPLTEQERNDIVAALTKLPLAEQRFSPLPTFKPETSRPVSYEEVSKRVFRRVCWHCHSDPAGNKGDGGPGNTGGFGYGGAGLDLGTYSGIKRGSRRKGGEYRSVLTPDKDGVPLLVSVMIERHREVRNSDSVNRLGMPLGLPPVPKEDIALVWGWALQER